MEPRSHGATQLRSRLGPASLTDPSWSSAYLRRKNTFIELVPPLSESVLGFKAWRQQTSEPTSPTAGPPASEQDGTEFHDQHNALDSAAVEKSPLAAASPCSSQGSVAALAESVANPSCKSLSLDQGLAGCNGGRLQISDEKLAGFSAWRRQTPKAMTEISRSDGGGRQVWSQSSTSPSSPANESQQGRSFSKSSGITGATTETSSSDEGDRQVWSQSSTPPSSPANKSQQGRSFSKSSGITEATTDVGSTGFKDQEALQDPCGFMDAEELAWRVFTGAKLAKRLQTEGRAAAVASAPLTEDGRPTSLGSFGHAAGTCRPCAHSSLPQGCDAGILCRFCHFDHPGLHRPRARPCKGKRERHRKLLGKLAAQLEEDPTSFSVNDDRLPPSVKFDSRMKAKLSAKMSGYAQDVHRRQEAVDHVVAMPR